jgi:hypothetical protein
MLVLSLVLNVAVLIPVCGGLISDAGWARVCYGPDSPARRILLSVYLAIGVVSAALLFVRPPGPAAALLLVQVVYKLTTPLTVGTVTNPVVASNLGIAAFHGVTLVALWRGGALNGWFDAA